VETPFYKKGFPQNTIMNTKPAADMLRPESFDMMVGQKELVGPDGILRRIAESGRLPSMIFFGPPGTGKTTAATILAKSSGMTLRTLNATTASLSDVKQIAEETGSIFGSGGILLYLDEIQYFNKKQQQSLLEYMEDGRITLVASTTENPYYYIYPALLSRSSVFEFKPVSGAEMAPLLERCAVSLGAKIEESVKEAGDTPVFTKDAVRMIADFAGGDVRRGVGTVELVLKALRHGEIGDREFVRRVVPTLFAGNFDGAGDVHYDLLSALQKSIRGSDPDAAAFYVAKLLEGGDIISVCRRLQVIASEDVGLAYPMAAVITRSCCESAKELGLPEARIPLANAAIMLATAPKSNTAYMAVNMAAEDIRQGKGVQVPEHLRSPLFKGYVYPHDYVNDYVPQEYLPEDLRGRKYYTFGENKTESAAAAYWENVRAAKPKKK